MLPKELFKGRAGHVPTFLKSFRSVLERGPSAKSFSSRSFFLIVLFSFRSVPFRSVLSRRTGSKERFYPSKKFFWKRVGQKVKKITLD